MNRDKFLCFFSFLFLALAFKNIHIQKTAVTWPSLQSSPVYGNGYSMFNVAISIVCFGRRRILGESMDVHSVVFALMRLFQNAESYLSTSNQN